jgi:hypothetical protein
MDKQVESGKDMDCVSDQKGPTIPQVILPEYSCSFAKTPFFTPSFVFCSHIPKITFLYVIFPHLWIDVKGAKNL